MEVSPVESRMKRVEMSAGCGDTLSGRKLGTYAKTRGQDRVKKIPMEKLKIRRIAPFLWTGKEEEGKILCDQLGRSSYNLQLSKVDATALSLFMQWS